jgi:UDP-N-acetylmuramoyl-tripeptide--D-alanyl-D-alanine ligase
MRWIKSMLFFPFASYFRFFAWIRLMRWKPQVIVVTGSSGKTTLMHLIASQLGESAVYSLGANSAYGVPFHILGLRRSTYQIEELVRFFLYAPFRVFAPLPSQKRYVVEVDCERRGEGAFLNDLLKPGIVLWLNHSNAHAEEYRSGEKEALLSRMANEYIPLIRSAQHIYYNADIPTIASLMGEVRGEIYAVSQKETYRYQVSVHGTTFVDHGKKSEFTALLPKETIVSIRAVERLCRLLEVPYDPSYPGFRLEPGRSSVFAGMCDTTIIDSTYNANPDSMRAVIEMVYSLPSRRIWLLIGDMIALGSEEESAHRALAKTIAASSACKGVVFYGRRTSKWTASELKKIPGWGKRVVSYKRHRDIVSFFSARLKPGDVILCKGAGFLEVVVERLLADKSDTEQLCRREEVWQKRRLIRW